MVPRLATLDVDGVRNDEPLPCDNHDDDGTGWVGVDGTYVNDAGPPLLAATLDGCDRDDEPPFIQLFLLPLVAAIDAAAVGIGDAGVGDTGIIMAADGCNCRL